MTHKDVNWHDMSQQVTVGDTTWAKWTSQPTGLITIVSVEHLPDSIKIFYRPMGRGR